MQLQQSDLHGGMDCSPPFSGAVDALREASAEAVNAVAYATKYHSEWFWRGVGCSPRARLGQM
jgi:hypothetical protein